MFGNIVQLLYTHLVILKYILFTKISLPPLSMEDIIWSKVAVSSVLETRQSSMQDMLLEDISTNLQDLDMCSPKIQLSIIKYSMKVMSLLKTS